MAKNLELISGYYKYEDGSKFLTVLATANILLSATFSPIPSSIFMSLGFSMIGTSVGKIIDLKDDLALINEMKKIYDEIVKHYTKLSKVFDFDDPMQMFALYVYMLKKGYLSLYQDYQFGEASEEINALLGAEVIMGTGVCRNVSALLNDIFKESGISSKRCNVFFAGENEKKSFFPNHTIVTVEKDGLSYLLDPTNSLIFQSSELRYVYVCKGEYVYLNPLERLKIAHNMKLASIEDSKEAMKKTLETCSKNEDILESFYKENEDLYEEMAHKKQKIQKYFR